MLIDLLYDQEIENEIHGIFMVSFEIDVQNIKWKEQSSCPGSRVKQTVFANSVDEMVNKYNQKFSMQSKLAQKWHRERV